MNGGHVATGSGGPGPQRVPGPDQGAGRPGPGGCHARMPHAARTAAGVFTDVPIGTCVRLVEVWHAARDAGYSQSELTARLEEEGRLVFEMVIGMYDTACQASSAAASGVGGEAPGRTVVTPSCLN